MIDLPQLVGDQAQVLPTQQLFVQQRVDLAEVVEQRRLDAGHVQVVIQRLPATLPQVVAELVHFPRSPSGFGRQDPAHELIQALHRPGGGGQAIRTESQGLAVVGGQQPVTNGPAGQTLIEQLLHGRRVAGRAGHLLAVHQHQLAVNPVAGQGVAVGGLPDGVDVLIMGKVEVPAAGVDVELLPQVFAAMAAHWMCQPARTEPHWVVR